MRNLKKFLALVLAMMMVMGLMVTANAATDYTADDTITSDYKLAVDVLFKLDVLQGGDNGEYSPKATITRGQFAMLLYRLDTGKTDDAEAMAWNVYNQFTDVDNAVWYSGPIGYVFYKGWMEGDYGAGGPFRPNDPVSMPEAYVSLLRVAGYGQKNEYSGADWATVGTVDAKRYGLDANLVSTASPLTKKASNETVAELIFTLLTEMSYVKLGSGSGYVGLGSASNKDPNGSDREPVIGEMLFDMQVVDNGVNSTTGKANQLSAAQKKMLGIEATDPFGRPDPIAALVVAGEVMNIDRGDCYTYEGKQAAGVAVKELRAASVKKFASDANVYINGSTTNASNTTVPSQTVDKKFGTSGDPWSDKGVLDYLTGVNNNTVEVYVEDGEITTVVVINTVVHKLTKGDITAATETSDGYISLPTFGPGGMDAGANKETEAFAAGDVVLYTFGSQNALGTTPVIGSVVKAESFKGKLEAYTTTGKYTIGGVEYEESYAGLIDVSEDDLGETYTWYCGPNNTIAYVDKGEAAAAAAKDYILVLTHGDNLGITSVAGAAKAEVYGVRSNGTYGAYTAQDAKGKSIVADMNSDNHMGLYTYTVDSTTGNLIVTEVKSGGTSLASAAADIKVSTNINEGDTTVKYNSDSKTAILNSDTTFVFVEITDHGTDETVKSVKTVKGSKAIGGTPLNAASTEMYVGVNNGVAEVVYVLTKYTGSSGDGAGVLAYVDSTKGEGVTTADGTVYTYPAVTNKGAEIKVTSKTAIGSNGVYELDKDNAVTGSAMGTAGTITAVNGSTVTVGTTALTRTDDTDVVGLKSDNTLKEGQQVVYVKETASGKTNNDLVAVWIVADQKTVKVTGVSKKTVSTNYEVSIELEGKEFIASTGDTAATIVKNIFVVTVKKDAVVTGSDATLTVTFTLTDAEGTNQTTTTQVIIPENSDTGSKRIWISSMGNLVIDVTSVTG